MIEEIETIEDYDNELQKLCREKFVLSTYSNQTADDWLKMADKFREIDARANVSYCINRAKHLGYVEPVMEVEEVPEPEFDWQDRKDVGD